MIRGVGIDSVEISRMAKNLESARFMERVFTPAERAHIGGGGRAAERAAANFAVKEALGKALGCGLSGCPPDCVEALRDDAGAPYIQAHGPVLAQFEARGVVRAWVSVTHEGGLATAFVVLEGD